jgi:C4-dicarboxylate-specific signal transduction histidine kinase
MEFRMESKLDKISETGLQFFGKMSASISHEIKNVLAIINENAGLLQDFVLMADQGMPIDPQRLKTLAEAVLKQIGRADGIVINLNRFAHSVDKTYTTVDLNDMVELVVALSARFAAMGGVDLIPKLSEVPVKLKTIPFFLMNLLWLCLEFVMDAVGRGGSVELVTEKAVNGGCIRFNTSASSVAVPTDTFSTEREKTLLDLLKAEFSVDTGSKEVVLKISGDINQ